jgi:hypothetical protein
MIEELIRWRVWPDGTVQECDGEPPYSHMSDDYMLVDAFTECQALREAATGNCISVADRRSAREQRIEYIKWRYECSREDALRFIELRDKGHSIAESAQLAGIPDPQEQPT